MLQDFLPSQLRVHDPAWQPCIDAILDRLNQADTACLYSEDGVLCAPSQLLLRPGNTSSVISNNALFAATGCRFAKETTQLDKKALHKKFKIQNLQMSHVSLWLAQPDTRLPQQSASWFVELFAFLGTLVELAGSVEELTEQLFSLAIFPVATARSLKHWELTSLDDGPLYTCLRAAVTPGCERMMEHLTAGQLLHPDVHSLCTMCTAHHHDVHLAVGVTEQARNFLEDLGVSAASITELVDVVLDEHLKGWGLISAGTHFEHDKLWPKLLFLRENIDMYFKDDTRLRKTAAEVVVLVPDLLGQPQMACSSMVCSHSAGVFFMQDVSPAASVVSCALLADLFADRPLKRQEQLVLWEAFLIQHLQVTRFSPVHLNTSADPLARKGLSIAAAHAPSPVFRAVEDTALSYTHSVVKLPELLNVIAAATRSETVCACIEASIAEWAHPAEVNIFGQKFQQPPQQHSYDVQTQHGTISADHLLLGQVFEPLFDLSLQSYYAELADATDPSKQGLALRAAAALGVHTSLSCHSVALAASLLEKANTAQLAPFSLEAQTRSLRYSLAPLRLTCVLQGV